MNLAEAILISESVAMLNAGRPQAEVTALAISAVLRKAHRDSLPDDWRIAITDAVSRGYPPEGRTRRPGSWSR